jgi:hypothetical protein
MGDRTCHSGALRRQRINKGSRIDPLAHVVKAGVDVRPRTNNAAGDAYVATRVAAVYAPFVGFETRRRPPINARAMQVVVRASSDDPKGRIHADN